MIKYLGINANKETLKNKSFFDNIILLINQTGALSALKGIKIQSVWLNSTREIKITDELGSSNDVVIDCGEL